VQKHFALIEVEACHHNLGAVAVFSSVSVLFCRLGGWASSFGIYITHCDLTSKQRVQMASSDKYNFNHEGKTVILKE